MVWTFLNSFWLRQLWKWNAVAWLRLSFFHIAVGGVSFHSGGRFRAQNAGKLPFRSSARRSRRRLDTRKRHIWFYLCLLHISTGGNVRSHNHLVDFRPRSLEHGFKTVSFHSAHERPWRPPVLSMWHQHGERHMNVRHWSLGKYPFPVAMLKLTKNTFPPGGDTKYPTCKEDCFRLYQFRMQGADGMLAKRLATHKD